MVVMYVGWKLFKRTRFVRTANMDLRTDRYDGGIDDEHTPEDVEEPERKGILGKLQRFGQWLFL